MTENTQPIAGDDATLMRRYVGAFYDLAEQKGAVEQVAADMRGLRRLWDESAEWRALATDPRLHHDMVIKAVAGTAAQAKLSDLTANFLRVVAQNRRLNLLPAFIDGFLAEMAARRGESDAIVHTARPLSAAQMDKLNATLAQIAGGTVHMAVSEDASLLGGLTVKMGSTFIDASLKARLDRLERALKTGAAA